MQTFTHPDVLEVLATLDISVKDTPEARTLPPKAYYSEAFHAFEKEAVFMHSWLCVGRVEQVAKPGDFMALDVVGEPIVIVRNKQGEVHAMSAVCQHRGHPVAEKCSGHVDRFVCPYHRWSYDLDGHLVGAPHIVKKVPLATLREEARLPLLKTELWRGFIFVNFDADAEPLAPTLLKLDPYFANFPTDEMVLIEPRVQPYPIEWNWKLLLENYIEPYHTEFVHPVIHDFAPSTGVGFDPWQDGDNAISRGVPFLAPGGGLTDQGWAAPASFPIIDGLSEVQKGQVAFCMLPPTMNLIFTPDMICYGIIYPQSATTLSVGGGLFTFGGWLVPRSTAELPDFDERAQRLMEGSRQLGEQDTSVNVAMQRTKPSRFSPRGRLCHLEETLSQFNKWLVAKYRAQADREGHATADRHGEVHALADAA